MDAINSVSNAFIRQWIQSLIQVNGNRYKIELHGNFHVYSSRGRKMATA